MTNEAANLDLCEKCWCMTKTIDGKCAKCDAIREKCELCEREVPTTSHHIIPKQKGGKELRANLCVPCHKQLHGLFTNGELKRLCSDGTLNALKEDERVKKFVAWVIKKNPDDIRYHGKGGFHK